MIKITIDDVNDVPIFTVFRKNDWNNADTNNMDDMREVEIHLTFYNLQNVNKSPVVCIELQCDNCNLKNLRLTLFGKMRWDEFLLLLLPLSAR